MIKLANDMLFMGSSMIDPGFQPLFSSFSVYRGKQNGAR
jgi:hypothetical protein